MPRAVTSPPDLDVALPSLAFGGSASARTVDAMRAADGVAGFGTDVDATLQWCREVAASAPRVGEGRTSEVWELLAATAARDVSAARMLEPHLDALSILAQADGDIGGRSSTESTWGVFAAEAAGLRLEARRGPQGWTLRGTKPWCSLAAHLTNALVTASLDSGKRGLFAVDLRDAGVRPHPGPWVARGMPDVVSAPVDFDDVPAVAVGAAGWYLSRPGFAWGGMSVAACWWGAAVGLAEPLLAAARTERADQVALVHLGRVDAALWGARAVLSEAAVLVDAAMRGDATTHLDSTTTIGHRLLAERVRAVVADAAGLTLSETDAALGPAPLVADLAHARRAADLHLYLRQHHGLRDAARIGRELVAGPSA